MKKLQGQVAMVIGATSGIGEASALEYAAEGATVVLTGRRRERLDAVADRIEKSGGKADSISFDVTDINAGYSAVDKAAKDHSRLDIIHCNSGMSSMDSLGELEEGVWDRIFDTNLKGHFFLAQHAIPELEKTEGKILFTSSLAGIKPSFSGTNIPYALTKAAIDCLVPILALDLAEKGIRVNAIAPGLILTEMTGGDNPEVVESLISHGLLDSIPMKRFGKASELAKLAMFLVSDDAGYITGQVVKCCGGQSIP